MDFSSLSSPIPSQFELSCWLAPKKIHCVCSYHIIRLKRFHVRSDIYLTIRWLGPYKSQQEKRAAFLNILHPGRFWIYSATDLLILSVEVPGPQYQLIIHA